MRTTRLPARPAGMALARCALRTLVLLRQRRIHQPSDHVDHVVRFADGTAARVYRETVLDRHPTEAPAVLVVEFRLRLVRHRWAHALFRVESLLNTVLFAGFPGFVSKLWLAHDEHHVYRGIYQWDGPELAEQYVQALWWPLALVAAPSSIHHVVLPGLDRDGFLRDPSLAAAADVADEDPWWRTVEARPA